MSNRDPEKRREYMRQWRAKNPDKVKANSDRAAPQRKIYVQAHLEKYAGYQRNYRMRSPRETLVNQAKARAKKAGLPFSISVEIISWPTHCPVLGIELDYNKTAPGERAIRAGVPTLDRKVNELGYTEGNVFVISHRANRMKSDATVDELEAIVCYMKSG